MVVVLYAAAYYCFNVIIGRRTPKMFGKSSLAVVAIGTVGIFAAVKLIRRKSRKRIQIHEKNYERDVVYLYQLPPAETLRNLNPFSLKLESFLRLNQIHYEIRETVNLRSKHNLLPFIEFNGEQIADSQLIEEHLKKHFNIQSTLSEYEEAISRSVARLFSHHTSNVATKYRYLEETRVVIDVYCDVAKTPQFLFFLKPVAVYLFRKKATTALQNTMGLFSDQEFELLLRKDLDVLKGILADKKFFFGDKITQLDASIFGHVATWLWLPKKGFIARLIDREYPILSEWAMRVREELFPHDFTL